MNGAMMTPMLERLFVGGPWDGRRVATDSSVVVVPLIRPVEVYRKVVPIRESPSDWETRYYRTGDVYRWEGLIEDAWCDIEVSDQIIAEGGALLRTELRRQMHYALADLAKDKEVGRIIWRLVPSRNPFTKTWRALVGPRAVERGLQLRSDRHK